MTAQMQTGTLLAEVQKAQYVALSTYQPLLALLVDGNGKPTGVFDRPPDNENMPYVLFGGTSEDAANTQSHLGRNILSIIHVYARGDGNRICMEIFEQIMQCLDNRVLPLERATMWRQQFVGNTIVRDPDQITAHGEIRFRIGAIFNG